MGNMPLTSQMNGNPADTRYVRGVEIFRIGNWNGEDYDIDDLEEMVAAFGNQGYAVPLKLGHDEVSGAQAYGWVDRIYREGEVLKADFRDLPAWVFDWVFVQHAYDHVSIEVYFNLRRDEKTFKRALKAVALLGAETPAVSGLKPLREAIFKSEDFDNIGKAIVRVHHMAEIKNEKNVEVEALTHKLSESAGTIAKLETQLQAQATQMASLTQTLATLTARNQAVAVEAKVASCKVPALAEPLRHLYSLVLGKSETVKFSETNGQIAERTLESILDDLVSQINKITDIVTQPTRIASNGMRAVAASNAGRDPGEELAAKTREYLTANKMPISKYGEAMQKVLASDADLRARYNAMASNAN